MRLPVLLGPTASGKTEIGIGIASRLGAEIVSADSRQVYRLMDIGTAKPSRTQLAAVRHHMIDVVDPDEHFGAGQYGNAAAEVIRNVEKTGRMPVVVGGSGLYIRALVEGFFQAPPVDEALREKIAGEAREKGTAFLHQRLREVDPEAARRIHPNDLQRISRALEVYEQTGTPISRLQERAKPLRFEPLYLGLARRREELQDRIDKRVETMVGLGFAAEVEGLLRIGYPPSLNAFRAVGYREMMDHIIKKTCLEDTIARIKRNTKAFARRQMTWFRSLPGVEWIEVSGQSEGGAPDAICSLIEKRFQPSG